MTYETARKALEQSVAIDPTFALAHASLARAYDELDYTDRAKDSMLRAVTAAQESRLTPEPTTASFARSQFMVSRDYARAAPLVRQIEAEAGDADRAAAALESGWLAQQMENSDEAAAAFTRALDARPLVRRSQASIRVHRSGVRAARTIRRWPRSAKPKQLYRTTGNLEGVTQTLLERANLLDRRNREKEALPVIEEALTMARAVGNRYQEVRLHFIEATAVRDLGDIERAATLVRRGIDAAWPRTWTTWLRTARSISAISILRGDQFDSRGAGVPARARHRPPGQGSSDRSPRRTGARVAARDRPTGRARRSRSSRLV